VAPEETKDSKATGKKATEAKSSKSTKKGEVVATPVEVEDPNKKPDPNANKVIPSVVHLKRDTINTVYGA
jgi:hypothetical protein